MRSSNKDILLIRKSKIFDSDWYENRYPEVRATRMSPVEHYLQIGWLLGYDPGPSFSTSLYLKTNPDVRNARANPLLHWLKHGMKERRASPGTKEVRLSLGKKGWRKVFTDRVKLLLSPSKNKRVAVFASYSAVGAIEDYVKLYLSALREECDYLIFVADNNLSPIDLTYLDGVVTHVIAGRHGEYDFGSYKRGIEYARSSGMLDDAAELILCNDSCYGPFSHVSQLFSEMRRRKLDFWGITQNDQHADHIQSYFVAFSWSVFLDRRFHQFFSSVVAKTSFRDVVLSYEVPMTKHFSGMGFSWGTLIDGKTERYSEVLAARPNITLWPLFMLRAGSPFIKVKAFKDPYCNNDGIAKTLEYVQSIDPAAYRAIVDHANPSKFYEPQLVD